MTQVTGTEASQEARILWQTRLDAPIGRRLLPLADGVVVPLLRGARAGLRRLAVDDGATLWDATLDGPLAAAAARTSNCVAVPLTGGRLAGIDLDSGRPLRRAWNPLTGELADPILGRGGRFYVRLLPGTGAQLAALEVGRPEALWIVHDPTGAAQDARLAYASGHLVVAASGTDGHVTVAALDAASGAMSWTNRAAEGRLNDVWAVAGVVDVVVDGDGILGLNGQTGKTRNQRFGDFPFQRALTVGEHLLMLTQAKGVQTLFCFNSIGEQIKGRLRDPVTRVVGASDSEVLVELGDGRHAFFSLPELHPIAVPELDSLGAILNIAWSRDVAYIVSEDRHTITALDLDAGGAVPRPAAEVVTV